MRFPVASLYFLVASFIFFLIFLFDTFLLETMGNALHGPSAVTMDTAGQSSFLSLVSNIQIAFGVICCLTFVVGILLIFILESWSDEPETYYR